MKVENYTTYYNHKRIKIKLISVSSFNTEFMSEKLLNIRI
ncbi:hypothetical protein [Domibacillus sp. A3M-37]